MNKTRFLAIGTAAVALLAVSCATTTISGGFPQPSRDGADPERRFFGELSKRDAAVDPNDPTHCQCDRAGAPGTKTTSAQKVASGDPTKPAAEPGGAPVVVREAPSQPAQTRSAETRSADQPGEVKNNVRINVDNQQPETRETNSKELARTPDKKREDDYFVVARGDDKQSVYDRKAEQPPGEKTANEVSATDKKKTGESFFVSDSNDDFDQTGTASWYGRDFDGRPTASGEIFDSRKLTAAHRNLPLGTIVLVRNMENNKELILRINDRGPFVKGRVLDVSEYASERLGYKEKGLATVGIRIIRPGDVKVKGKGVTKGYYDYKKENSDVEPTVKPQPAVHSADAEKKIREVRREYRPEDSVGGHAVQVGLFEKEENALVVQKSLRRFNVPVRILKRGSLFVVRAGSFADRGGAEGLRDRLAEAGYRVFVTGP